jgi:hypothetical protein
MNRFACVAHVACIVTLFAAWPPFAVAAPSQRFSIHETAHGVRVEVAGGPFADYMIDEANKPFLWPVVGPTGKPITRGYPMADLEAEPKQQRDHVHQRGISFGHEDFGGDTWHERATYEPLPAEGEARRRRERAIAGLGAIRHRSFTRLHADDDHAVVEEICDHVDPAGAVVLVERRRLTFRASDAARTIDIDQDLTAGEKPVTAADRKDAGLYVRVPPSMAVDMKQGGRIVNSEGQADAAAWSQPARWCDYHGPVDGEQLGIAILNHPTSFRHPTRWHVRTYGLFAANPFASRGYDANLPDAAHVIAAGETLRLRHRIILHVGDEQAAGIDAAWQDYAKQTPTAFTSPAP